MNGPERHRDPPSLELLAQLLADQHPDLADLPLRPGGLGLDTRVIRIGETLAARLPVRELGARCMESELDWLPILAPLLPLPVPAAVRRGEPGRGYPWKWAIVPWYPGAPASGATEPLDMRQTGADLGNFLTALHQPAPTTAPLNPCRGGDLLRRAPLVAERVTVLEGRHSRLIPADTQERWTELARVRAYSGPPRWLHGDLHSHNVLVDDGRITAVIDFGDLTSGDPATDLAGVWFLLDGLGREAFRAAYPCDDDTWLRGRGWAVHLALAVLTLPGLDHMTGAAVRALHAAL